MIRLQFLLLGIGLVWLATIATSAEAEAVEPLVTTGYGKVKGKVVDVKGTNRKVKVFLGIPFLNPPVGQLRFYVPQPPEPSANVRDATSYPLVCTQAPAGIGLQNIIFKVQTPLFSISEDCLYLNIYTPALKKNKKRAVSEDLEVKGPVKVWLHGGAMASGGSIGNDGSAMAVHEEVVILTLEDRLRILGFFSTGDEQAPGNRGLQDQVQGLKWTKEQIANFGGDPGRITIHGQSAGGLAELSQLIKKTLARE